MTWETVTEKHLAATISQLEIDLFRQDAAVDGSDPVAQLLERTSATVRIYLSATSCKMGPYPTVPPSLIGPTCDIAAYQLLKRQGVPVGEDRRLAQEAAYKLLDKIVSGALSVESDDSEDAEESDHSASPAYAPPTPTRLCD